VSAPRFRSGGRPTAEAAAQLEPTIIDHATAAFLADGYAATSIEAIARQAHVAKRTIYARWDGKAALFLAVVRRLIDNWLVSVGTWREDGDLPSALREAARSILTVALTAEAVALYRLIIAEGRRFPELYAIMRQAGADEGARRIVSLLVRGASEGHVRAMPVGVAAEQFMQLILGVPQRRALAGAAPMTPAEIAAWCDDAVALFLSGVQTRGAAAEQSEQADAANQDRG
jgi:TetR/AcrR family transcriptional regulator, mexJK operon transcriptional repressor